MHKVPTMFSEKGKRTKKPPKDELFLTQQLDSLSWENPKVRLTCGKSRARWWAGLAQGIINRTARESLIFLPRDDPTYGFGQYAHIEVSYDDNGITLEWLPDLPTSPHSLICQALALGQVIIRPRDEQAKIEDIYTKIKQALARMRMREKYVELHLLLASVDVYIRGNTIIITSGQPQPTDP